MIRNLLRVSFLVIKDEGLLPFMKLAFNKVYYRLWPDRRPQYMRDVLFVVGPHLPQVKRYRVDHQVEQLMSNGMTADIIYDDRLTSDKISYYRAFVFCRYPHTEHAENFIKEAKKYNKTIIFEIDDLVFDTRFTDSISTVQNMSKEDRDLYDSGVARCGKTLELCDYAIATTQPLADELLKHKSIKDVYVNRNVASDEMVSRSSQAVEEVSRDKESVTIGYFSGSITHNEDFEMILPDIIRIMEKYPKVKIHIGGILDEQSELTRFGDRITTSGFVDWRRLPHEIRKCDINLAPLAQKSIFNEAKSEIKWLEAALVQTVTVATDFGAFNTEVKNGKTGVLVKDNEGWFKAIEGLIKDGNRRNIIAKTAYNDVTSNRTTLSTGKSFADWLMGIMAKNIVFVLPSSEISGGVNVVLKHADILREDGRDVTIINNVSKRDHTKNSRRLSGYRTVIAYKTVIEQRIDEAVATLWATVPFVRKLASVETKSYFVQNFETDFLKAGDTARLRANSTYCYDDLKYTTMSVWCQSWLKEKFSQDALYASNGLWGERYGYKKRNFSSGKIKILIEGDPQSEWKNVDEAFRITNKLDKTRYEINFLSYYAEPKDWYAVDNFHQKVPSEKVGEIYAQNDILLKTSLLESFSYPPLEMMATGGFVVVIPNGGNLEYLRDEENCLMFDSGDEEKAISQIERIASDAKLRDKLSDNGIELAHKYDWENVKDQVLRLYN